MELNSIGSSIFTVTVATSDDDLLSFPFFHIQDYAFLLVWALKQMFLSTPRCVLFSYPVLFSEVTEQWKCVWSNLCQAHKAWSGRYLISKYVNSRYCFESERSSSGWRSSGERHKANTTQSASGSAGETFWPSQAVSLLIVNSPSCSQSPGTVSLCSLPCSGGFRSPPLCWLCIIIAVTARPLFWGTVPLWSLQPALVVWLSATQRAWLSVWSYNLWWICKVWASVTSVVIMTFASPFALLFWGKDSGDLYRCLRLSILQLFSQCFASEASLLCSAFGMPARYSPK